MDRSIATTRSAATSRVFIRSMGTALRYPSGASNYADLGSSTLFDSTKVWAISFWANLETYFEQFNNAQGLFNLKTDQGVPFVIFLQSPSSICLKMGGNSIFPGIVPSSPLGLTDLIRKGWHQIIVTFDGVDRTAVSSYKLYVDSMNISLAPAAVPSLTTHINTVGILGGTFSGRGTISTIRIWNGGSAFTATDATNLYFNNKLPSGMTILREYLAQEGSGTQLTDTSANAQHGTINGGVTWVTNGPLKARALATTRTAI